MFAPLLKKLGRIRRQDGLVGFHGLTLNTNIYVFTSLISGHQLISVPTSVLLRVMMSADTELSQQRVKGGVHPG